jgi:hypothetical protein
LILYPTPIITLGGRLQVVDFPYESAYNLLQIGWGYNYAYDKKIERVYKQKLPYKPAYDLVHLSPRKAKKSNSWNKKRKLMFPEKLNNDQFKIDANFCEIACAANCTRP